VPPSFYGSGASRYSCADEANTSSESGGSPVAFSFVNHSSESVMIVWFNYTGTQEFYGTLPPGYSDRVTTSTDYFWMVADPSNNCLAIFKITGTGQVVVS
jgi:hypothetical protein